MKRNVIAKVAGWIGTGVAALAFIAGVVVLMLYLAGKFTEKVPNEVARSHAARPIDGDIVEVVAQSLPVEEWAVGTIRAEHETSVASKLLARVIEVRLKAGQPVTTGEVLIRLDDTELRAKLKQVAAALNQAEANYHQAEADERRASQLARERIVSQQEYERSLTTVKAAAAEVRRAGESVNELQALLDDATIRSPIDGQVIEKLVEVGDTAKPGQTLVTIYDPRRMQMVANVRESLAHRLQVGQRIGVAVDGLNKQCEGTVSEKVPQAQAASRSFQVKVTGPCPSGIYSGMFGRIMIPLDEEKVLLVPSRAVRRVGQLELVDVVEGEAAHRRAIRVGRPLGDAMVEVLSGLSEGDRVVVPRLKAASQESGHE